MLDYDPLKLWNRVLYLPPLRGVRQCLADKLKEYRKRGIASALLVASMKRMKDAGFESAGLDVDSANPTGAHGLYQRLGFTITFQSTIWERQVG